MASLTEFSTRLRSKSRKQERVVLAKLAPQICTATTNIGADTAPERRDGRETARRMETIFRSFNLVNRELQMTFQ